MIKPRRIGHATFETPDLEKAIAYHTQVNGLALAAREKDRAFLATKIGQLVVQLDQGDEARCIKLSFEVAPNSDFNALSRELGKEGIKSEQRSDSVPGMSRVLAFEDNKGTGIELFSDWNYLGKHEQVFGAATSLTRSGSPSAHRRSPSGLWKLLRAIARSSFHDRTGSVTCGAAAACSRRRAGCGSAAARRCPPCGAGTTRTTRPRSPRR
jgi:catechol 2,3-dioxygenase-like lactoylglutathione lyase family enzyme